MELKRLVQSAGLRFLTFISVSAATVLPLPANGQNAMPAAISSRTEAPLTNDDVLAAFRGRRVYDSACAACHGVAGDAVAPVSDALDPAPRDFTSGVYKFRSTPSGQLPTDEDLYRTITDGIPRTSMPGWRYLLTEQERRDVVAYIKSFSAKFEKYKPGVSVDITNEFEMTPESTVEGKYLYLIMECWACHGVRGKGDGQSASTLKDEWGEKIKAFDFTIGNYKGGSDNRSIYKTFITGLNGTPMPSYADAFLFGGDSIDDLSSYKASYSDSEIQALRAYLDAQPGEEELSKMSETELGTLANRRRWALVHFVKSLSRKPGLFYRLFVHDYEVTQ